MKLKVLIDLKRLQKPKKKQNKNNITFIPRKNSNNVQSIKSGKDLSSIYSEKKLNEQSFEKLNIPVDDNSLLAPEGVTGSNNSSRHCNEQLTSVDTGNVIDVNSFETIVKDMNAFELFDDESLRPADECQSSTLKPIRSVDTGHSKCGDEFVIQRTDEARKSSIDRFTKIVDKAKLRSELQKEIDDAVAANEALDASDCLVFESASYKKARLEKSGELARIVKRQ